MIRFCPHCHTERPLTEIFCAGMINLEQNNSKTCGWDLTLEPIHESGWRPLTGESVGLIDIPVVETESINTDNPSLSSLVCTNGHPMNDGDFICFTCGADAAPSHVHENTDVLAPESPKQIIGDWQLEQRINGIDSTRERYLVNHITTGQCGILTLYQKGEEPDPAVYQVLKLIPTDHVPEFYQIGRWQQRAWHVTERLSGGSLSQFIEQGDFWQPTEIPKLIEEMGQAIAAFTEHGLRHRDLRPSNLLIRSRDPLDIVVIEYSSACLSEFDLDIVSPLDISRYSAPETLAGGVSAASDWWSLGIILLEQLTQGECFAHIQDNAFLIQVMTNGIDLPDDIDSNIQLLLRGLLCRDRFLRWQWPQVSAWLQGHPVQAPESSIENFQPQNHQIQFASFQFSQLDAFAMVAGEKKHWDEAVQLLMRGEISSWVAKFTNANQVIKQLQNLVDMQVHQDMDDSIRLTLVLKILNPNMPFVYRGEIITPSWLLDNPSLAYQLICEPLSQYIQAIDAQHWLVQLYYRQNQVRQRAQQQNILLSEQSLRLYLLITSISQLSARWDIIHQQFPDSHNESLQALFDRQNKQDVDYILLLSADIGQLISLETIINEASVLAKQHDVDNFNDDSARQQLLLPRNELYSLLSECLSDFKRIGIAELDSWSERYLLTRRLPLNKILVMLSVPINQWQVPESQKYILEVLHFFSQKLISVTQRGSLVRMRLTQNTGRVDLTECDNSLHSSSAHSASVLLEHIINRKKSGVSIDSDLLLQRSGVNNRLRILQSNTQLYQRDTGINGMYLGFPFLLINTQPNLVKPRIAPLFLWPVSLLSSIAQNRPIQLSFDNERAAIRLNPALANFVGIPAVNEWQKVLDKLLSKSGLSIEDIMDTLSSLLPVKQSILTPLPIIDDAIADNSAEIVCSAVLFHTSFIGQAMSSDLQQIASLPINQTALATMLNLPLHSSDNEKSSSTDVHFDASTINQFTLSLLDPSQEQIVNTARTNTGLLIEGPPGTGKSQTIVSLIADAIGLQKTALVICQKPAALEVVYKRLVASGLSDRVLMVNQNQKSREIILAVREQIEQLWAKENNEKNWLEQRLYLVSRVQRFEEKLDHYYQSMYQVDNTYKLSYKEALTGLIQLEQKSHYYFDNEKITEHLCLLNKHSLEVLTEDLRQHGLQWWQLDYENSALRKLAQFSVNDLQYELVNQYIVPFIQTEKEREQAYASAYNKITITQLANHEQAIKQCEEHLLSQSVEQWQCLSKWLVLFLNRRDDERVENSLIAQLEQLNQRLLAIDDLGCDPLLFQLLAPINNQVLAQLSWAITDKLEGSFFRFINPFYYQRQGRLNNFIASSGMFGDKEKLIVLLKNIKVEQQWRLLYQELLPFYQQLSIETNTQNGEWRQALHVLIGQLKQVESSAVILAQYPEQEHIINGITNQPQAEFTQLIFTQQCLEIKSAILKATMQAKSLRLLHVLQNAFTEESFEQFSQAIDLGQSLANELEKLNNELSKLAKFQLFREQTAHFTDSHWYFLSLMHSKLGDTASYVESDWVDELIQSIKYEFFIYVKRQFEVQRPALAMDNLQFMSDVAQLTDAQKQLHDFNKQALPLNIEIEKLASRRDWEEITRLAGPRARRLREFISEGSQMGLMQLRPIWLMTPDVASQVLPLKAAMFDSVIYDEASQMPIEFALSTLFRGKKAIVSGDEKQMPPSKFFTGKQIEEEDNDEEFDEQQDQADAQWDYRQITDCPDLLHLARTVLPVHTLDIHYRSAYRELINFSNFAFYENRLNIPAQLSTTAVNKIKPLHLISVGGTYINQSNEAEAIAVVEYLEKIWQMPFEKRPSIGVVTFNQKQALLINQHIRAKAQQDEYFLQAYTQENQRQKNDEDMSFFVKNVENVQGDERDVILFSTTFGRNAQGTFRRNFGVLGQTGGERRLNVAITRARQQVIIMSSMPIDEISDLLNTFRKPDIPRDYLQGYLAYATNACNPLMQKENERLLNRMCHTQTAIESSYHQQDAFIESVKAFIQLNGWKIAQSKQTDLFYFDCLIEDENSGNFLIGIECDMPFHPLLKNARARELWRKMVLKQVVPVCHRVSIKEWYYDRTMAQQHLFEAVNQALLLSSTTKTSMTSICNQNS